MRNISNENAVLKILIKRIYAAASQLHEAPKIKEEKRSGATPTLCQGLGGSNSSVVVVVVVLQYHIT